MRRDVWLREAKASGGERTREVFLAGREGADAGDCAWLGDGPRFWRSPPVRGFAESDCKLSSFARREFGRLRIVAAVAARVSPADPEL